MASMIHFPNATINQHVTFPTNTCSRSASFGQICMPKKADIAVAVAAAATELATRTGTTLTTIPTSTNSVFGSTSTTSSLADEWREIHGSNNWENMVDPLHPLLRQEIIRYGNLVNACYKAFDLNPNSKRYLNCKYGKRNMFREIGMDGCGYDVTKYIYATPDINIPIQHGESCCRWMGYVAVSSDDAVKRLGRRDILISFRGTVTHPEWVANLMSSLTPARLDPQNPRDDVKVESGFLSMYTSDESESKFGLKSCREQLLSEVSRLLSKYRSEDVSITLAGHSMGSSLALLLGYDIAELGLNRGRNSRTRTPITVFSFGGPRVGNSGFKERCEELGVKVLRVANVNDPITKMPGVVFNHENFRVFGGGSSFEFPWSCSCYAHVGVELMLDFFNMQDPACVHDMGAYISLLKSCPKRVQIEKEGADLMKRAKEMLANLNTSTRNLNMPTLSIPWRSSVASASNTSNMVNLQVQSQRT